MLKTIAEATEPNDLMLFYNSGHGAEAGGEGYLVARDGRHLTVGDTAIPLTHAKQIESEADRDTKDFVIAQDASRHVTNDVKLWAGQHNAAQMPTLRYSVVGDIILTRCLVSSDKA